MEEKELCPAEEADCKCKLPKNHEGPHECIDTLKCNGSWFIDDEGKFHVVRFPMLSLLNLFNY